MSVTKYKALRESSTLQAKEGATRSAERRKKTEKGAPTLTTKELLLELAEKLRQKGHQYYNINQKDKTAIFWELESICRELARRSEC